MRTRRRFGRLLLGISLTLLVAACGGADGEIGGASTTSVAPATTAAAAGSPLVGEWRRTHKCEEVVEILREAGFKGQVVLENIAGNGFLPGVSSGSEIADVKQPCKGAVPLLHSHFFTADGQFGSKDQNGQQVEDGTYKIVDDRTFVISGGFLTSRSIIRSQETPSALIPLCHPARRVVRRRAGR
jgi:hypothetical protein